MEKKEFTEADVVLLDGLKQVGLETQTRPVRLVFISA